MEERQLVDPLKIPAELAEPIGNEYKVHFAMVKNAVLGVLEGESEPADILATIKTEPFVYSTDSLAMFINRP